MREAERNGQRSALEVVRRQSVAILRGEGQQRLQGNGGRFAIALDVGDEILGLILGDADARHAHVRVFGGESQRNRVLARPHLLRADNEIDQPGALPAFRDASEVGADTIAASNRVDSPSRL